MRQEIYIECDDIKGKRLKRSFFLLCLVKKNSLSTSLTLSRVTLGGASLMEYCPCYHVRSPLNRVLLNFGNLSISVVGARERNNDN